MQHQNPFTRAVFEAVEDHVGLGLGDKVWGEGEHLEFLRRAVDKLGNNHRGIVKRIGQYT